MRQLSPALLNHLQNEVTTLACCFLLTLQNGSQKAFTDYVENLAIDQLIYLANSAFSKSAIASDANFTADNLAIEAVLDNEHILETDLLTGIYDGAKIEIFLVNYLNPGMGKIHLKTGFLGQVSIKNSKFNVEIVGLAHKLQTTIGNVYTNSCRATFADNFCKIKPIKQFGKIEQVISSNCWIDQSLSQEQSYFNHGMINFISGRNKNYQIEVKDYSQDKITTILNPPYQPEVADLYEIITGCDKSFSTCINKFNNALNFRGEPHINSIDL